MNQLFLLTIITIFSVNIYAVNFEVQVDSFWGKTSNDSKRRSNCLRTIFSVLAV